MRRLNLEYCSRISDQAMLALASFNPSMQLRSSVGNSFYLTALNLNYNCKVTRVGLKALIQRYSLQELRLRSCRLLDDETLQEFSQLTDLTVLDLSECSAKITKNGMGVLSSLTTLRWLSLASCQLSNSVMVNLMPLRSLTYLDLSDNAALNAQGLEHISDLVELTELNLSDCLKVTNGALLQLALMTKMQQLNLSNCQQIAESGLVYLARQKNLKSLNLKNCSLTDEAVKKLSVFNQLERLQLWGNQGITDQGIVSIAPSLTRLTSLDVCTCIKLTNVSLEAIGKYMKRMRDLNIASIVYISEKGIHSLSRLKELTKLNLSWCSSINDAAVEYVSDLTNLRTLNISSCRGVTSQSYATLSELKQLRELDVSHCVNFPDRSRLKNVPNRDWTLIL